MNKNVEMQCIASLLKNRYMTNKINNIQIITDHSVEANGVVCKHIVEINDLFK